MLPDDIPASNFDFREAQARTSDALARVMPADETAARRQVVAHELDKEPFRVLHSQLIGMYLRELRRQEGNRFQQAKDQDFYDSIQWDEADAEQLRRRGQVPIVYNVIKTSVDWIIGSEKRSRTDYKVLPRRKDASKQAERKSQLLKYLSDVNRSDFHKSRAFEDAIKCGVGWLECGIQADEDGEPVYDRYESWRNVLWDSAATELDLSDARYIFRSKWVDEDVAIALFPERKGIIERSARENDPHSMDSTHGDEAMDSVEEETTAMTMDSEATGYERRRVRMIECWFRRPKRVDRIRGGDFNGQVFDPNHPGHNEDVRSGRAVVVNSRMMRMHVAIMTQVGLLWVSESPYAHNDFPFTPIWGYRRGRDNMPYGVIRSLRDIQADINKRASKALHILSSNKVIMDEGAVPDLDEFAEEVSRPDAIIVKAKGHELTLNADRDLAPAHLELMSRSIAMIQQVSGVTDELMGRTTNATSGIAIGRRQEQGQLATAGLFDNLRLAMQIHGEKKLSLIEEFFTEEKSFRITNMRGSPEYITVNDGLPENDIVRSKADFIISEDEWRASVRQAQTVELLQLIQQLAPVAPQVAVVTLDLIIEAMDIPNRDELVKRIRQQTGMRDPDAEEPTPEELQQMEAAAEQAAMQKALLEAEIAGKQAKAQLTAAQAEKTLADARRALSAVAGQNVNAQKAALEAALLMLNAPASAPVADGVLHEAGFMSRTEEEDEAAYMAALEQQQQQQQMEQQNVGGAADPVSAGEVPNGEGGGVQPGAQDAALQVP